MDRKYIQSVKPLTDHVLQVDFISGSRLLLDMKPYLDKFRFRSLSDPQVWNSAVTNGIFVRFGDVEMSHNELFSMAEQEHHRKGGKWYEQKAVYMAEKSERGIVCAAVPEYAAGGSAGGGAGRQ